MYGRVDPEGRRQSCWSSPPPYSRYPRALRNCRILSGCYQTQQICLKYFITYCLALVLDQLELEARYQSEYNVINILK